MTWDKTIPLDTETEKLGDNRIRETAQDLETALQAEGIFPGPAPLTAPVFWSKIPYDIQGNRPTADATYAGRWFFNTDTKTLQRQDSSPAWGDIACRPDLIPSGATMVFYQSAAPAGWTQVTDASVDDRILRVTGAAGGVTGGVDSIASPPMHSHGGNTGTSDVQHSHATVANGLPLHVNETTPNVSLVLLSSPAASGSDQSLSGALNHAHGISAVQGFKPGYVDVILATRN